MKNLRDKLGMFIGIFILLFSTMVVAQQTGTNAKKSTRIERYPLNDFEASEDWRAFATSPLKITKLKKIVQQGEIIDVFNPGTQTEIEKKAFENKQKQNHVLGVKTFFKDKGFDRVEIKPPHEYIVKGIGRQISVWVLGRNFRHTLYVKVRDYLGKIHKLKIGRLNFLGWRKLTVTIPGWLPQSARFALLDKNFHFVSLFIVSDKHEPQGTYYFYFDELSMLVDKTAMTYPGSEIKDTW